MRVLCLAVAVLSLSACTPDFLRDNEANVILQVVGVEATAGGEGQGGAFLLSDVVDTKGGAFNDNVVITLRSVAKNQNPASAPPGVFESVNIERYEVSYRRSDGLHAEGVDVPYRITGNITQFVPAGGEGDIAIIVVRHTAKDEPPLLNIANGGGAELLTVFADIVLHGHTTSGKGVTASATLQITFGNFVKATGG
jgi:hypothetical protein